MSAESAEIKLSKASSTPAVMGNGENIVYVRTPIALYQRALLTTDRSSLRTGISEILKSILSSKNGQSL